MVKVAYEQIAANISYHTPGLTDVRRKHKKSSCVNTASYFLVKPFLLQCAGPGIDFSGEIVTQFPSLTSDKIIYATSGNEDSGSSFSLNVYKTKSDGDLGRIELSNTPIYHGQQVIFQCCGLSYHHSIGRIQRIGWNNGTVTRLRTPENDEDKPYTKDFCFTYTYDDPEEYYVEVDKDMSYFECIVPLWNDVKPASARIDLNVQVIETLKLVDEDIMENITYNENQSGLLFLNCSFLQFPENLSIPEVEWTRNGNIIRSTDKYASIVEKYEGLRPSSILLFMRAIKQIEGEYECMAENVKDSVQRTFTVKVKGRSYTDYWIALAIFGGFFAVIIVLALRVTMLDKEPEVPSMKVESLL